MLGTVLVAATVCLLDLPERLFADPSESDRFAPFAAERAGDRR
ncbi:hypothetical protein [Streptomyces sp. NPDC001389]